MTRFRRLHPVPSRGRVCLIWLALAVSGFVVLAACADAEPIPVPVRLTHSPTQVPAAGGTLPPTWTPTATWTPRPPTLTPLPTPSPTITLTPDAAQVCSAFELISAPDSGINVRRDGRIAFSWRNAPADAVVRVAVVQRASGEGILVEWPPQQSLNMPVEMMYLPYEGIYDWTLSLYYADLGDLCPVEGWFVRSGAGIPPTPTP